MRRLLLLVDGRRRLQRYPSLRHGRTLLVRVLVRRRIALRPAAPIDLPRVRPGHRGVAVAAEAAAPATAVIIVVQRIGRIVLRVLQPRDQSLVLVAELAAHQRGFAHHHHVLQRRFIFVNKNRQRRRQTQVPRNI